MYHSALSAVDFLGDSHPRATTRTLTGCEKEDVHQLLCHLHRFLIWASPRSFPGSGNLLVATPLAPGGGWIGQRPEMWT
jgi:hypothetical protein